MHLCCVRCAVCGVLCGWQVLHVRSVSSWAPVCIGPYAQANVLHDSVIFVAGTQTQTHSHRHSHRHTVMITQTHRTQRHSHIHTFTNVDLGQQLA